MDHLVEMLKEMRIKKGWSQEGVARKIGVSLSTVQRWEKLGGKPSLVSRQRLVRLFKQCGLPEWP